MMATGIQDPAALIAGKIKELPPLPLVVHKLLQVTDDDRSNAEDVQGVLSADQALAGKVLKLVNSSFYGMSGEVSTISRAVVILGFAAIRNLATGLGVVGAMAQAGVGPRQEAFWAHAITTAATAQVLAEALGYEDPEEAFIAGLIHDIGYLILAKAMPQEFDAVVADGPWDPLEREQAAFGVAHPKVGQKLLRHWKLPEKLGHAARFHHNLKSATSGEFPLTAIIALADSLSAVQNPMFERTLDRGGFLRLIGVLGVEVENLSAMLAAIEVKVEETRLFLKLADVDPAAETGQPETPTRRVVVLSTDPLVASWLRQVMNHFGHILVPMKEFFAAAGGDAAPDLIILDQESISSPQLQKMKSVLVMHRNRLAAYGNAAPLVDVEALGMTLPVLPVTFSRFDLEELVG